MTVRCSGRFIPLVLSEASVFLSIQRMIELQLMSVSWCRNNRWYFGIYLDALIERNETKYIEKPVGSCQDIVRIPMRKYKVLHKNRDTVCSKISPEVAIRRIAGR